MTTEIFQPTPVLFCPKKLKRQRNSRYIFVSATGKKQKYSHGFFLDCSLYIFHQLRIRLHQGDAGVDGFLRNLPSALHRCLVRSHLPCRRHKNFS